MPLFSQAVLLRFSNVTKAFGGAELFRNVSFQIDPGEKVALVGRNGAGKTTIFNMIIGREEPDAGSVIKASNLKVGLLEQHIRLPHGQTVISAALSAFETLNDISAEMRMLEKRMEADQSASVLERYAELQARFENADGFASSAKAGSVLLGLGFSKDQWDKDVRELSGGQLTRLGMVRLLLADVDVLLLDEPTNHLDIGSVEWLEDHLRTFSKAFVVISHDRYFLDKTTERTIEIERGNARSYKGSYTQFLKEKALQIEQEKRKFEQQEALIKRTEEFIRRNIEGQKTKQARSRRKMLDRLERIEAPRAEKRIKSTSVGEIIRAGDNVLITESLSVGFNEVPIIEGIDLHLQRGESLGIIGANGSGKTTLLRTLIGEIPSIAGRVTWGAKVAIGYYAQSNNDLVHANDLLTEFRRAAPDADNGTVRSFLAKFLFFENDLDKRVADLSGGERARLALAKIIFQKKNVLVLDEPTNHLDIPAREALESMLTSFPGTVITVSHDRYFLDLVADRILFLPGDGTIIDHRGNYSDLTKWLEARHIERAASVEEAGSLLSSKGAAKIEKERSPMSKNRRQRLETKLSEIEAEIGRIESNIDHITALISDPVNATDRQKLSVLLQDLNEAEKKRDELYVSWDETASKLSSGAGES